MSSRRSRKRRQHDGKHRHAIPKILAELPFGHHGRQVAVGGSHDPDVDVDRPLSADAFQPAVLQDAKQPDLRGRRQFAQFVEQQRAAVGPLEPALAGFDGPGERAPLVAEQLRVDQFVREWPRS